MLSAWDMGARLAIAIALIRVIMILLAVVVVGAAVPAAVCR